MEQITKQLETIGLTTNQAKIYSHLIDKEEASVCEISKATDIYRVAVYKDIQTLCQKHLVNEVLQDGTKRYHATNPNNLTRVLEEKNKTLKSLIPQLKIRKNKQSQEVGLRMIKGKEELKKVLNSFLEKYEPILVWGVPVEASKKMLSFFTKFHEKRIDKKVIMKHIYNTTAQERIEHIKKLPLTQVKILKREYDSPVATNVCGDTILFINFKDTPITAVCIQNKGFAESFKNYFELMWMVAKG